MRATTLTVCFAMLCALAAPAAAEPQERDATTELSGTRKPASPDELAGYAQRERAAQKQLAFKGGRGGSIEIETLLLVVLIVLLVVIIV